MTRVETRQSPKIFRKNLVIPSEHGAWSWLLVPFLVGALVAASELPAAALPGLSLALLLLGSLCGYMMRQPATALVRIRRGRGRQADQGLVIGWLVGFGLVTGLSWLGLLVQGRLDLLWLALPFALILVAYLLAARRGRSALRALGMELAGAAALALTAPAATIAWSGTASALAWAAWGLMALQNTLGVLYVRLRLADTHGRAGNRGLTLAGHAAALLAVLAAGAGGLVPTLAALPFAGFLLRAIWAVRQPRPVANVRRFGFGEVGVEILGGLLIVAAYAVAA